VKNCPVAYLLWLLGGFGVLGLHRFYLGRWITGLIWLFTGGLFFIGALIDLILVAGMVRVENLTQRILAQAAPFPDR
jgi:TM2 domain-containing membrane protein YozV